jgi:hypothetical protein
LWPFNAPPVYSATNFASALRRGGFFVSEKAVIEIQIDANEVDFELVEKLVLALADAVIDSELEPSAEEMFLALGELMQAIVEEVNGGGELLH